METSINQKIWQFLTNQIDQKDFETWVYETPELEEEIGKEIYFDLISSNFEDDKNFKVFKTKFRKWAEDNYKPQCHCWAWQQKNSFPVSNELIPTTFYDKFDLIKKRVIPQSLLVETSWLIEQISGDSIVKVSGMNLVKCRGCQDHFYVAHDPFADNILALRLTQLELTNILENDLWPKNFDNLLDNDLSMRARNWSPPDSAISKTLPGKKNIYPTSLEESILLKFKPNHLGLIEPELQISPKRNQEWFDKEGKSNVHLNILNSWIACRGWVCQFLEDSSDHEGSSYHIIVAFSIEDKLNQKYFQIGYDAYHWTVSFPGHLAWFSQTFSLGNPLTLLVNPNDFKDVEIFGQLEAYALRDNKLTWCAN